MSKRVASVKGIMRPCMNVTSVRWESSSANLDSKSCNDDRKLGGQICEPALRKHIFEAMKVGRVEKLSHQQQR